MLFSFLAKNKQTNKQKHVEIAFFYEILGKSRFWSILYARSEPVKIACFYWSIRYTRSEYFPIFECVQTL